ncbi:MAG: FAD-dependent oxidoreductase, partial [Candidatus Magasanikbacteria bacterium]|nr:FAD-dependent oxidoreductase [Candidatus Magasanikbacteria bacterium]
MLDLIIIGGSAAGCSAAVYAARRKLNFKIITNDIGGEVASAGEVKNWPGIPSIYGYELAQNFANHVRANDVEIEEGWKVTKIKKEEIGFSLEMTNKGENRNEKTKTVIIATGIHPRHLGAKNEDELFHKGVTYCTVCDGPIFKNKITATLGGGNAALESAIMMSEIAQKVYLMTIEPDTSEKKFGFPTGDDILIDKVKNLPNVKIIHYANTYEFVGDAKLTGLKYYDLRDGKNEEKEITIDAAMVHVGMV